MALEKNNKVNTKQQTAVKKEVAGRKISFDFKTAAILLLVSFITYANTLKNDFVLDDAGAITKNTIVTQGISAIPEILSTPYRMGIMATSNDLYRPLSLVMFSIEYEYFGPNPAPYHFFTILLFAACVILLFIFLNKFFDRKYRGVAFIAALLFALHPVHTEVVANIKSCDELLCFLFAFAGLNLSMRYTETGKIRLVILASGCFFLSLLSKETTITFVALVPLIFFFIKNENKKRSTHITIGIALAALVFLFIRFSVLGAYHANEISAVNFIDNALAKGDLSPESRIATAILIMAHYLKLLFVPYPLISDYSYNSVPFTHFSNPLVLASLAIYIFLIVFAIKRFFKNHEDPYAFGIIFYLITISLFSNIFFLIGTTMGERLLFFPSVGFCLIVALLIKLLAKKTEEKGFLILRSPKISAVVIPVCLVYAVLVVNRDSDWKESITLYRSDVKKSPEDSRLNFYLGNELTEITYAAEHDTAKQRQIINESISYLKKVIAICPEYLEVHKELGRAYFLIAKNDTTKYDSAAAYDMQAIKLNPASYSPYNNLAAVYIIKAKYPEAIQLLKKAIELNPDEAVQYANLGLCYQRYRKYDSAIYYLNKAAAKDPALNAAYQFMAITYKDAGKLDSAKKYEAIAQKNNPGFKL